MRLYEIVYIFDASLTEEALDGRLEKYHELATGENGSVNAVDHWGVRQLAYPIARQSSGYYVVAQFGTDPSCLPEFERVLKLDDELMRFLIVLNEGEPTSGMSIVAQRPAGGGDAEEEEDEEDEEDGEGSEAGDDEDLESPPEFSGGRGRRRRHEGPAIELLNYKDVGTLSRFLTEQGKILPKRTTKVTARFQRQLGSAVKRARYLALVPYVRHHEG